MRVRRARRQSSGRRTSLTRLAPARSPTRCRASPRVQLACLNRPPSSVEINEAALTRPLIQDLFTNTKPVVGVIHVGALPGTPASKSCVEELTELAAREAAMYRDGGVDGLMVENMHDVPYLRGAVGPEIVAAMAVIARAVKSESRLPVGVQILAGANKEAMSVAHAAGLDYVRVEGFVFAHVADEGLIQSSAAELLRFRKLIGAERVRVWADVKKKHSSHAITAEVSLGETAAAAGFMRGASVVVTGGLTREPPRAEDVRESTSRFRLPVLLGSGMTAENVTQ